MTTPLQQSPPHIAIFPFLSKGHTIPLIHLAHLLHRRRLATVTFITTPLNAPYLRRSLAGSDASLIDLPFPQDVPAIPTGVESTDSLPSISLFLPFVAATKLLQPHFEQALSTRLNDVALLISDGFYGWTTDSASKFGIPRVVFYGMGNFVSTVSATVTSHLPHAGIASPDEAFPVPGFPRLQLTKADLNPPFDEPDQRGPHSDFVVEVATALKGCQGIIVNSFYELEADYFDHWNANYMPKSWCIGPLCLARPKAEPVVTELAEWLDSRSAMNRPVLYVAFGSQADVSVEQLQEIAAGLEASGLDFLWVVRTKGWEVEATALEERVKERGRVVREWVDQPEILRHESVKGFVSHCGWNSVMESVCAGVPVLAWPMMAEQHLNAKFVVDVVGIGLRIRASDGTKHGLVKREDVARMVKELVGGEGGRMAVEKVGRLAAEAEKAMMDGGSSAVALERMIEEAVGKRRALQINGH